MALSSPFKTPRKARQLPLLVSASRQGFRLFDYRLQQLFDTADIVSEGARKTPAGAPEGENSYFGTTNIVLTPSAPGSVAPLLEPDLLVRIFAWDPHVRVRALRIACREAQVRAQGIIDRVRTEIVVSRAPTGIRIHVDLEARVLLTFPGSIEASLLRSPSSEARAARKVL